MAFVNKIGNILRHGVGKNANLELSASNGSLFQTIRSMSSSKLFVGGEKMFFLCVALVICSLLLFTLIVYCLLQVSRMALMKVL